MRESEIPSDQRSIHVALIDLHYGAEIAARAFAFGAPHCFGLGGHGQRLAPIRQARLSAWRGATREAALEGTSETPRLLPLKWRQAGGGFPAPSCADPCILLTRWSSEPRAGGGWSPR